MTELHSFELPGKPRCGLGPNDGFTSVPDIFFNPPPFVTTPLKCCSFCNSGQIGSLETAIRRTAPKLCNVLIKLVHKYWLLGGVKNIKNVHHY